MIANIMKIFKNLFGNGSKIHANEIVVGTQDEHEILSRILDNIAYEINLKANTAQEDWIPLILQNNWVQTGAGYQEPAYYKDTLGNVHIKGRISGGADATVVANLRQGYRPSKNINFVCPSGGYTFSAVSISIDGNMVIFANKTTMPAYIDFGEIIFRP